MDKNNEACSPAEKVGKAAERAGQLSFQLFVATRHDLTDESAAAGGRHGHRPRGGHLRPPARGCHGRRGGEGVAMGMTASEVARSAAVALLVVAAILLFGEQLFWLLVAAGAGLLLRWAWLLRPTLDDVREALGL